MEIKVLGTVSPYPKGNMNCSGFLINDGEKKIMLDCGPGSSRMLDMYKDLRDLVIFISHYHPDHYSDLFPIGYAAYINERLGYLDERIKVLLPKPNQIDKIECGTDKDGWGTSWTKKINIEDYDFIKNVKREHYFEFLDYSELSEINIGSMNITFKKTKHPIDTYSARIENHDGVIVYSADTGFKDNKLVEFSQDADILICEATYLRGQNRENDYHLYAYEAAKIAREANVKNLYLFHTYPEIDKLKYEEEAKEYFKNTKVLTEGEIIKLRKER